MHNETHGPHHPSDETLESQLVQLTRDLVLIESTHSKPGERKRCFQFVRNHLDGIPNLEMRMYESEGYESLVALPAGIQKPDVLFCAHLDVVEHLGPEYYQSKIEDGKIHGPGAGDMKGALAIVLYLFRNMLLRNPDYSIGLAITSDEERGGENGARHLVDEVGLRAGSVVIPDGGSIDEVTIEEKGILHVRAWLPGRSAHAARPWLGDNPLQRLAAGLNRLELRFEELAKGHELPAGDERSDHWHPTCSITRIESDNQSINRIPDEVVATFDIRFPEPHTANSMLEILAHELGPRTEIQSIITAAPTHLDPDPDFLKAIEWVLGRKPHLAKVAGGSDARFFRKHGIPVKLSRPVVGNLHGHDEWIDIRSMVDYYRICERYVRSVHGRE